MSYYPEIDEVFPLEVDGWTRFFKLVLVCRHSTRERLGKAIWQRGVLAPIGVRDAFMKEHPNTSHRPPVGFAPEAWVNTMAGGGFPFIDCSGDARLEWVDAGSEFIGHWLWLVEV